MSGRQTSSSTPASHGAEEEHKARHAGEGEKPEGGWPTKAERKGKRAYNERGAVRPADGRWPLYEPDETPPSAKRKP